MPNQLDANGLTVKTVTEIAEDLTAAFQSIYGPDINVEANSPDGQLIAILAQALSDNLQLLAQVYNSFAVESAFGTVLDQRVAMSGVTRSQGSYTTAYVAVTATAAVTLTGQDALIADPGATVFAVSDTAGNQFQLETTYAFGGAGTQTLIFKAVTLGQVQTTPNTIQTIVTVVLGVASVNNPSTASDVEGLPEETDPQLKIKRVKSYFLQAVAPADAIRAALLNAVPNCVDAYVAENDTSAPSLGVPAHGLWVIVNGGAQVDIADAIYKKKNPGCALTGAQSYAVVRPQGDTATMRWDNAVPEDLYVRATLLPRVPGQTFDTVAAAAALADALVYKLGQSPNSGDIAIAMAGIEPLAIVTSAEVSIDGMAWSQIVTPATYQRFFLTDASKITLT